MAVRQVASRIVVDVEKTKFVCTEMSRCKDCENTENDNYESDDLSGIDVVNLSLNLLLFLFHQEFVI